MIETYNSGYAKALLDVKEWFDNHSQTLRCNRLYNEKGIRNVFWALLENREELRDTGDVELIVDKKTKKIRRMPKQEDER